MHAILLHISERWNLLLLVVLVVFLCLKTHCTNGSTLTSAYPVRLFASQNHRQTCTIDLTPKMTHTVRRCVLSCAIEVNRPLAFLHEEQIPPMICPHFSLRDGASWECGVILKGCILLYNKLPYTVVLLWSWSTIALTLAALVVSYRWKLWLAVQPS